MRLSWVGRGLILLVALGLCYLAATSALATAAVRRQPALALTFAPSNAGAQASTAFQTLQADQSPATVTRAEGMARRALSREPVNVIALRALGLAASLRGDLPAARARFALVERLSRRDLPTQLWWIEHEVQRDSIPGALTYFDEALRTSASSSDLLMPILVEAVTDAPIAAGLLPLLAKRPTYFRPFFVQATDTISNIDQVVWLGTRLLDSGDEDDRDLINRILARLGRDGKLDAAWRVFGWATGSAPPVAVVNGDFDRPVPFRLFNWTPTSSDTLTAEIGPREGSDALYLIARVSRGLAAQQLLRLPPGRYRLDAVVGDVPDAPIDRPTLELRCAEDDRTLLAPVPFPATPVPATPVRAAFSVAPGCTYQWLNLSASASSEDETRAWIDDVRIRPIRNR